MSDAPTRPQEPIHRNLVTHHRDFRTVNGQYSVSGRRLRPDIDVIEYLQTLYSFIDLSQIESVFGTDPAPSKLYGGWGYSRDLAIQDNHAAALRSKGIGVALTTTNHYFDEAAYRESWPLLEKHHNKGNSLIITHDEFAKSVRRDFPEYQLKASITKNLNTLNKIERAFDLYDLVLVPMDKNDDDEFLMSIPHKDRIILFMNAGCAYNCPARMCYVGNSQGIQGMDVTSTCSRAKIPRPDLGYVIFDVKKLADMGFCHFKLIPPKTAQLSLALREKGWA
jgi:hypothetical protein